MLQFFRYCIDNYKNVYLHFLDPYIITLRAMIRVVVFFPWNVAAFPTSLHKLLKPKTTSIAQHQIFTPSITPIRSHSDKARSTLSSINHLTCTYPSWSHTKQFVPNYMRRSFGRLAFPFWFVIVNLYTVLSALFLVCWDKALSEIVADFSWYYGRIQFEYYAWKVVVFLSYL